MTPALGNLLIRVNAGFLIIASAGGLATDIAGSFFGRGAEAALLADAPGAGIGFIEAHGLALIIGLTMWRIAYSVNWHAFLAAVHALLGTANLLFWQSSSPPTCSSLVTRRPRHIFCSWLPTSRHWRALPGWPRHPVRLASNIREREHAYEIRQENRSDRHGGRNRLRDHRDHRQHRAGAVAGQPG
ncbi:hypothetical protein [Mesorhizobium ventifaucium]|uniref:Uncharacterized protein n=1 Tax=Mesorhizobium ventifaucium TaxID=666020 RepID=A0ABM9E4L4_9HYPH|nr:hypothetical protein [Mesorhizobium ventifaucium]CAH2404031.1 hypothetical protein MES4922_340014 [Mesorhizobium ventifaucium]